MPMTTSGPLVQFSACGCFEEKVSEGNRGKKRSVWFDKTIHVHRPARFDERHENAHALSAVL